MFDDHKNEEPGWREYWQSGGTKRNKKTEKFPRALIYIILIMVLIYVFKTLITKDQTTTKSPEITISKQNNTNKTEQDKENVVGKTVSKQLKDYLDNIEPYQNSLSDIITKMKNNLSKNKTYIDYESYDIYKNCYDSLKTPPMDLGEYRDILSEKIIRMDAIIPEPNIIITINDLNKIINTSNDLKLVDLLSEFFEKYNYRYDHTTDERVRYWYKQ